MFIYLSKKIAIPNNTQLRSLAWNGREGYISCGGDEGLLKVLKLDSSSTSSLSKARGLAAPSNLSMNQTLEGHNGQIQVVVWNERHQKLTTSDEHGLIIVWMLYKGSWYEEMINNRNKSVVRGMAWNKGGERICIVYEDGAVIVGSVDGNRIWGKELKLFNLVDVCWAPDSSKLLFAVANGEVHVFDAHGSFVGLVQIQCLSTLTVNVNFVVAMHWFEHAPTNNSDPVLAICYDNGRMQLMRDELDENPVLIDSGLQATSAKWNDDGSVLAVSGSLTVGGRDGDSNVVLFYTPKGEHLRTLKIPGKQIAACAWEGGSLRIALAVDSFIYFANIRPDYMWAYLGHTVVYAHKRSNVVDDESVTVVSFWNALTNERNEKVVGQLKCLSACNELCVVAHTSLFEMANVSEALEGGGNDDNNNNTKSEMFTLALCNALGSVVNTKLVAHEPNWICLNSYAVITASRSHLTIWHFGTSGPSRLNPHALRTFHIDQLGRSDSSSLNSSTKSSEETSDPMCSIVCSEKVLLVARESGVIQQLELPGLKAGSQYQMTSRPHKMRINVNETLLAVIDVTGVLQLVRLSTKSVVKEDDLTRHRGRVQFERRDVWDVLWSSENSESFVFMEKTRMYIVQENFVPESDPILSAGYLASFKELSIRSVLLDELIREPEEPDFSEHILDMEVKVMREARALIETDLKKAHKYVEEHSHLRLWKLLAGKALEQLDFEMAETAFVRAKDYAGIQMVKKMQVKGLNTNLNAADVQAFLGDVDKAERIFIQEDRRDLAVQMRRRHGDWPRVLQLLSHGSSQASDEDLEHAHAQMADKLFEEHNYYEASKLYEKARVNDRLAECYFLMEDFDQLENLVDVLQPRDPALKKLANMFASVGMARPAVDAFIKDEDARSAINLCIRLNQWHEAISLASQYNLPTQISSLLDKYAAHLLSENRVLQAVELYRKAQRLLEAANLLSKLAVEESQRSRNVSLMRVKKLHVLSALLIEEHLRKNKTSSNKKSATSSLSSQNALLVDGAWRGAEAFHFLMLCQRQLYQGSMESALRTAIGLTDYESELESEQIYCLLALASCGSRAFGTCSSAFIRLEALEEERSWHEYRQLAIDIFVRHSAKDGRGNRVECPHCDALIPDYVNPCPSCETRFALCIVTGKPMTDLNALWTCSLCHHRAFEKDVAVKRNCPLCHAPITS